MKRFHIHVGVKDLKKAVQFYSTLFGQEPSKLKGDYAKWMLENPRLNFAISTKSGELGVNHLGIQVEEPDELEEITSRLKKAEVAIFDVGETTCCYSKSNKAWAQDPAGIPWEAYQNMADAEVFGAGASDEESDAEESDCCAPGRDSNCCE